MTSPNIFDRRRVGENRLKAARNESSGFLLEHAGLELASRVTAIQREFHVAADIGADRGVMARLFARQMPALTTVSFAPSLELARLCPFPRAVCDEEALPIKAGSLDLAVSVLSLHLVNDLPGTLIQIRRALRPDGLFLAALLGGDTLIELRQAFMQAESETAGGVSPRVFPTADVRDMGGLLQRAGFALPVADTEQLTVTYPSPTALMRELKAMGAANALAARSKKLLRRDTLSRAAEIYTERFPAANGRVRATFEILYLTGWAPHESQQKPLKPGSAAARLADALGTEEIAAGDKAAYPTQSKFDGRE